MVSAMSATVEQELRRKNPKKADRAWLTNPLMEDAPEEEIKRMWDLREQIVDNGCDINLCFILEASSRITDEQYTAQKNFVDLIIAITTTDEPGNYCAASYDTRYRSMSVLTSAKQRFLDVIHDSKPTGKSSNPDVVWGLAHSIKQLRRQRSDANTVVFFSAGKPKRTRIPQFFKDFVRKGNAITGVTFDVNAAPSLAKITGDIQRIVPIDGFFEISEMIVAVVADLCSTDCNTLPESRERDLKHNELESHCPTRLGVRKFKHYKGIGGVGVGFGNGPVSKGRSNRRKQRK